MKQKDVREFMKKFAQYIQDTPDWPSDKVMDLRIRLVAEEFCELMEAAGYEGNLYIERSGEEVFNWFYEPWSEDRRNFPKTVDSILDLVYVLLGQLNAMGVDGEPIWDEIHRANMQKVSGGVTGALIRQGWQGEAENED